MEKLLRHISLNLNPLKQRIKQVNPWAALLIGVGVLIIVFTGWYVWQVKNSTYNFKDSALANSAKKTGSSQNDQNPTSNKPGSNSSGTSTGSTSAPAASDPTDVDDQCVTSLSTDSTTQIRTCSVSIRGYDGQGSFANEVLVLSLEWVNSPITKEPPITATCTQSINTKNCRIFYKDTQTSEDLPLNKPTVINSQHTMSESSAITITGPVNPTTIKFSFPYDYSYGGADYYNSGINESYFPNKNMHVNPTYYLTWQYKKRS